MPGIDESIALFIADAALAHQIVHGDDETVVETEGGEVKSLAKAVGDLEESATASAATATAAAGTATAAADTAAAAADTATGAASTATTQAGNAATSAGTASDAASAAVAAAISAGEAADTASGAAGSATTAAGDAATAQGAAEAARDLAQTYAAALAGTSASSLTIGTGEKIFTTQAGKQWALGQRLRAASDDGTKVMDGEVTAYGGTSLTLDVDYAEGTGTHDDWNLSIIGARGGTGAAGATWYSGTADPDNGDGSDGDHYLQLVAGGSGGIGSVWRKITGAWSLEGNIRGPAGAGTGDVNGPGGSTDNELVIFDGTTGKLVKASGVLLAAIALLASPALTGTPTAPTASGGTNTTQIATTAFVQAAIAALVGGSPSVLDTLNELAEALGNDANFATTVTNALAAKAPLASPALTGNPTAPTQSPGDNSTKLATTAYADALAALKANLASPTFTGTPAAPTATGGTNTTQLATTAFVQAALAALGGGLIGMQVISASGTYTKTSGTKKSLFIGTGGGGGGGGADNARSGGAGGGAGATCAVLVDMSSDSTRSVTIGAAGTAGNNTGTNGGAGGTTSVGSDLSAGGGSGGAGVNTSGNDANGGAGGNPSTGTLQLKGGSGDSGMSWSTGVPVSGSGGASFWGGGGRGHGSWSNTAGQAGQAPGSGGGGGAATNGTGGAGGVGAAGLVWVLEFA